MITQVYRLSSLPANNAGLSGSCNRIVACSVVSTPRKSRMYRALNPVFERARLEAALGQPALQRHLAAFETDLVVAAGARMLALVAAPGGLAQTRPDAAADAPPCLLRARRGRQRIEFHRCPVVAAHSTSTRYATLSIIPRTAGVSSSSRTALSRRRPRPRTVARCDALQPIGLLTSLTLSVFLSDMTILRTAAFSRRSPRPSCRAWPRPRPRWSSA